MTQFIFKRSFLDDHTLVGRLFELLETGFPGIIEAKRKADPLDAPWEQASTPFIYFHGDVAVTHVGVLEVPLIMMGRPVKVGGIHAVCTRPEFRRRGYYREVFEEVLKYCEAIYETLVLTTAQPELYEPFGFRVVTEHVFKARPGLAASRDGFRTLDNQDPGDVKLLHRLLESREPVSRIAGVASEKVIFCFNEARHKLRYAEDLDAIALYEFDGATLKLYDIVWAEAFPLAALIERAGRPVEEVQIYFSPDRLGVETRVVPHVLDMGGRSLLMARGPFAIEGGKFMIPRSARC